MNLYKKILLSFVVAIIFILSYEIEIFGQTVTESFKTYDISSYDVEFNELSNDYRRFFLIDKWWDNIDAEIEIKLSINQLVTNQNKSYIKICLNGIPFYSKDLYYIDNLEEHNINVAIPKRLLKVGSNELKIVTDLRLVENSCQDHIANWMVMKKDSRLKFKFNDRDCESKILNFPYPFIKNKDFSADDKNSLYIYVPEDYKDCELTAAFLLKSYLNSVISENYPEINIVKYDKNLIQQNVSSIYIGRYESYDNILDKSYEDKRECFIKFLSHNSSYDKSLLILCNDDQNLINGIKFLENKVLVKQIDNDSFSVNDSIVVNEKIEESTNKISLDDLSIGEIKYEGPFRREHSLDYFLPTGRQLSTSDKIKLFMRYAENLDFNKSLVSVYINDIPVGSKKLEIDKCLSDELELNLPKDVIDEKYVQIRIVFDLELKDQICQKTKMKSPWAVITGDSYISIGKKDVSNYVFKYYSYPFVKDGAYNNVIAIIPDKLQDDDIKELSDFFVKMSDEVNVNSGDFKVVRTGNITDKDKDANIIVYGTPNNNIIIKDLNTKLWFQYEEGYEKFKSNEKRQLLGDFNRTISNFQLDISKYNSNKGMMILTSPDESILRKSLFYFDNAEEIKKLNSDCLLIDSNGNIENFKFKHDSKVDIYDKDYDANIKEKGLLVVYILFFIFSVITFVFYIKKNHKKY